MSRELFNSYRRSRMRKFETGGDINPLDENGNERIMPKIDTVLEQKKGNVETYQLNLKGKKGKSSASKDYIPEGTKKNGKYLHYTEEGPKWLDDPLGVSFEQEASEGTVKPFASGYEYIQGQGWTYKGGVPAAPTVKKEKKRKKEKLIKLPSIPIKQIPTSDLEMELKKAAPFELRGNSDYYTTEMKGKRGGRYVKDGVNLKDQAGRLVWTGTKSEYQEIYGDFLEQGTTQFGERRKDRLYLKKEHGGYINPALMDMHRHNYGGNANWNKHAKAEYGKTIEQPVDQRALRDNVSLIQPTPVDSVSTPALTVDTVEQELNKPVKEEVNSLTVNKHGWADLEAYRKKKDDTDFIMGTQDFLIENGWKGSNDGAFGNKTYAGMNEYLTNRKLDEYSSDNFTEDQFYDQIYKESHGKNDKVSPRGAIGLAQFMPSTFTWAKEKGWIPETAKISDPAAQSLAQRKYMDHLYNDIAVVKSAGTDREERQARAFASYNHGPDNFKNFWEGLTTKQKDEGWKTWYKEANDETQKYVLWMMDKAEYKRLYNTPETRTRKDGTTFKTSKWNDVYYGYESWRSKNHSYRY